MQLRSATPAPAPAPDPTPDTSYSVFRAPEDGAYTVEKTTSSGLFRALARRTASILVAPPDVDAATATATTTSTSQSYVTGRGTTAATYTTTRRTLRAGSVIATERAERWAFVSDALPASAAGWALLACVQLFWAMLLAAALFVVYEALSKVRR